MNAERLHHWITLFGSYASELVCIGAVVVVAVVRAGVLEKEQER